MSENMGSSGSNKTNNTLDLIIQSNIWQPEQPLRLHLGCGENYLKGYVNIDFPQEEHPVMNVKADIYQDITQLQFPNESVDEIRLHHVFEHFSRITALALLIKWHIWLKVGGKLHIETPDLIGIAKTLLSNAPWTRKMAAIRHLSGSHEASWAFHLDHWFPERFERTLARFGFDPIETETFTWPREPFLSNVQVVAVKKLSLSLNELMNVAQDLLKESMVAEAEKPLFNLWCEQLRSTISDTLISTSKEMPLRTIIFSKNRAMQLDATLRSYLKHCKDFGKSDVYVLYLATNEFHKQQYRILASDAKYSSVPIKFVPEKDFRNDLIALLSGIDYVLFLTDDNIFVKDFTLQSILNALQKNSDAIGFSLRLGKNTTYCYPFDKNHSLPEFEICGNSILKFNWTNAEYDFGYPLELSSSIYRISSALDEAEKELQNWVMYGKPIPPPKLLKQKTVVEYANKFLISTFVETGTYLGEMIEATRDTFKKIYSVELDEALYQQAKKKFAEFPYIEIIKGDSGEALEKILANITEPCLFWLDTHYSGGITAKGEIETPIIYELHHILTHKIQQHVILIDDARMFVGRNGWPKLEELRNLVLGKYPDWVFEVKYDIIRIHKRQEEVFHFGELNELSDKLGSVFTLVNNLPFRNPNTLESVMYENRHLLRDTHPFLLCFENSVTFCAPINMVQTLWKNRAGNKDEYSAANLAKLFEQGLRIDTDTFDGFIPNACHQEIELKFIKDTSQKPPLVSVIIPCYALAHFLPEAVESVVRQTFTDWECVIVNDGSPDNTSEIAKKLISKYSDKRISLVEKENGGPGDARNAGIKHSQGKFILPLDADDLIYPTFLEKAVNILLENPNIHIVYSDLQEFGASNNYVQAGEWNPVRLRFQNHLNYCSLYRREVWESVGGYHTNVNGYEDWDFWIGCLGKDYNGQRIPEPLLAYRVLNTGMYSKAVKKDLKLKAQIILNHPELYTEAHIRWGKAVLANESWIENIPNTIGVIPVSIPTEQIPQEQIPIIPSKSLQNPIVSVIVPTYNRPKMLPETIRSILNQTLQDFEIVVVNDAGGDVASVVRSFGDKRIQYFSHLQNKGLAATRNTGIKNSKGKYLAYLDDDDVFFPNHLETLVNFLENHPKFKIAYTDARRSHQTKINDDYVTVNQDIPYSQDFDPITILFGNYIPVLCIMHHRSILDEVGLFDETLTTHEDWDLWIRVSRKYPFYHIKQVTCEFSWREDATTMTSSIREDFSRTMGLIYFKNKPFFQEEIEKAIANGNLNLAESIVLKLFNIFDTKFHPEPLIDLGVIRSLQAKSNEAIQIFQKILELHPDNEIARENLKILSEQKIK